MKAKYSGYKWIGDIPNHWEVMPIKAIAKRKIESNRPDLMLLSVYRDYGVVPKDSRDDNHNRASEDLTNYKVVKKNNLVLNKMKTWQGSLAVSEFEGIVSPAYIIFELAESVFPKYIHYLLRSKNYIDEYHRISYGIRISQWDMHFEDFRLIPIILPSLEEQKNISAFLDLKLCQIDVAITKKQKLIDLLLEKRQVVIDKAITKGLDPNTPMKNSGIEWLGNMPAHWEAKRLKHLTNTIIDGTHFTPEYVDNGIPFLRVTDITARKHIDLNNAKFITPKEHFELIKRCKPKKGDLLLSKNGTIGVPRVIDWDFEFSIFVSLCLIKFNSLMDPYFASFIFESNSIKTQIDYGTKTNTVTNLHLEKIREFIFPCPSIEEQQLIVKHLKVETEKIDKVLEKVSLQIEKLQEYRQSLISEVVTGKIDLREFGRKVIK